jgi:ubiquinone/menaquinone biosynthesis C-methylase UbiE
MQLAYEIFAFGLLLIIVVSFTMAFLYAVIYAPFVPTPYKIVKLMLQSADIKKGDNIYDVGCGDGRIAIEACKKGATATGIEIAIPVYILALLNVRFQKSPAKILRKNFMKVPINDATHIFCYLWPRLMNALKEKFTRELKPGSKIISYSFPIKDWKPIKTVKTQVDKDKHFLIYVYEMGISNK